MTIPQREREVLSEIIASLEPERALLKLVAPDLLHVTLRFLGPVPADLIDRVATAARVAAEPFAPFELTVSGLGAFPSERAPRVLWAGIEANAGLERLRQLAGRVDDALFAEGFTRENRAFSPHVTVARTRDQISAGGRREVASALQRVRARPMATQPFAVREVAVMRSDPGPSGPRYTTLLTTPLAAPSAVG